MSKKLNKNTTALSYADETLLVLSGACSGVCLRSYSFAIETLAGIMFNYWSNVLCLMGSSKCSWKQWGGEKNIERLFC